MEVIEEVETDRAALMEEVEEAKFSLQDRSPEPFNHNNNDNQINS